MPSHAFALQSPFVASTTTVPTGENVEPHMPMVQDQFSQGVSAGQSELFMHGMLPLLELALLLELEFPLRLVELPPLPPLLTVPPSPPAPPALSSSSVGFVMPAICTQAPRAKSVAPPMTRIKTFFVATVALRIFSRIPTTNLPFHA
jgi:hypothetical protein